MSFMCRNIMICMLVFCFGCNQDPSSLFTLMDPGDTGIEFKNTLREDESANVMNYLYFYNGGGVAVGDLNNDGLPDLLFTGNMVPNRLYLNKGNFEFEDITERAGIAEQQGWCTGATMIDINQDGLLDIYICRSADVLPQRRQNLLYINQGDGRFTEQAMTYGLADAGYSTQAVFFDYDRDNDPDMFLINHSQQQYAYGAYENASLRNQYNEHFASKLYRNDGGRFTDVSRNAGIVSNVLSFGLGVAVSDLNCDGWPDLYVSNDFNEPDHLYINNRNGTFTNRTADALDQVSLFSMGSDIADVNNDGRPDIITMDMLPEDNYMQKMHTGAENFNKFSQLFNAGFFFQYSRNMLHLNNGDGTFSEYGQMAGISNTDWSWSTLIADLDNDGKKDVFVTNGYARDYTNMDFMRYRVAQMAKEKSGQATPSAKELLAQMPSITIPNVLFRQDSIGKFHNVASEYGIDKPDVSSGAVYADLDNDGDLDLVINNINEVASVYKNNTDTSQNHFLKISLAGPKGNIDAIGASVTLHAGNKLIFLEQQPVRGFQSSVDRVLHAGLGSLKMLDSVVIKWPNGTGQLIKNVAANTLLQVKYAPTFGDRFVLNGTDSLNCVQPGFDPLFTETGAIDYQHRENFFNDFTVQTLLPSWLSRSGPCFAKADVNGDGLEDLFVGGAKGQGGSLFIQTPDGSFYLKSQSAFAGDSLHEDCRAVFFDADGDKDFDLYVASGGYEFSENDPLLQDRLYLNDGKGNFASAAPDALPAMLTSKGVVAANDFDGDGDTDLFVGGRVIPGRYPVAPRSYLLRNDGKGKFTDVTATVAKQLETIGMITDAAWVDLNGDKVKDLVIVGEWMPVVVMINKKGLLSDESSRYIHFASTGRWNRMLVADLDNDGDDDLLIGNMGTNGQLKASAKEPVYLQYKDFDGNGSIDPVLYYYIQGTAYPFASRDDLVEQLPMLNKKYLAYEDYAKATMNTLFSAEQTKDASLLKAETLETVLLRNDGAAGLVPQVLPRDIQSSPIYAMAAEDLNGDGIKDLVIAGNLSRARIRLGRFMANHGLVLMGSKSSGYHVADSGLMLRDDIRDITVINNRFLFGVNNGKIKTYQLIKNKTNKP